MQNKTFTNRLQLLNNGREHYLNYLRNLTPQILIFSIVILAGRKLDFTRFDFNNFEATLLFFILLGSFMLAVYANSTIFYEHCFSELKEWIAELDASLKAQNITRFQRFLLKIKAVWHERLLELSEVIILLWFPPITLAIVIGMSIPSALNILKITHAG